MKTFNSSSEILEFAIGKEQESIDFYAGLARWVKSPAMKDVFTQFSLEETGHKKKLQRIEESRIEICPIGRVLDLKIADYSVEPTPNEKMDYQKALLLAMQREKASFRLYEDLASRAESEDLRCTFLNLAQEEARHKLRFEIEYDECILTDN